jgi:hypothetical protein
MWLAIAVRFAAMPPLLFSPVFALRRLPGGEQGGDDDEPAREMAAPA